MRIRAGSLFGSRFSFIKRPKTGPEKPRPCSIDLCNTLLGRLCRLAAVDLNMGLWQAVRFAATIAPDRFDQRRSHQDHYGTEWQGLDHHRGLNSAQTTSNDQNSGVC